MNTTQRIRRALAIGLAATVVAGGAALAQPPDRGGEHSKGNEHASGAAHAPAAHVGRGPGPGAGRAEGATQGRAPGAQAPNFRAPGASPGPQNTAPERPGVQRPAPAGPGLQIPERAAPRGPEGPGFRGPDRNDQGFRGPPGPGFRGPDRNDQAFRGPPPGGPGRGQFFDNRFGHGRYYPPRGFVARDLPPGYHTFYHEGRPYFFVGGVWYLGGPAGYIVSAPPPGLVISVLPPFYTTVWLGGVPYYYADDVYYRWDPGADAYQVVAPPPDTDELSTTPPPDQSNADQLFIYPKNGQTEQQQAQDRYECHTWASGQTGFDPTQPGGGVPADQTGARRNQYNRAMTACLEARGYTVN